VPPRPPELKPYRLGVYALYGGSCAVLFFLLLRSVIGDLYGKRRAEGPQQSATACLEDIDRLYGQLSARAIQPAPGGLDQGALAREWDQWSRRWEDDLGAVSARCQLESSPGDAQKQLAEAMDGIEELRRNLASSGTSAAEQARRVRESLSAARKLLRIK
jgi:hypothetical protein